VKRKKNIPNKNIQEAKSKKSFNQPETKPLKSKFLIWLVVIAISVIVAYSPSLKNGITNWDDDQYVEKNPWFKELSVENVKSMFASYYMGNYHPLSILSLSIDYQINGIDKKGNVNPKIYHYTNLLLHVLNTLLVFWLVFLLFSKLEIAVISSLLFGLSTLHVESVAWISERKDVLYALFFIASLIAYVYYIKHRKIKYYIYAFVLFVLSLFSKGQAVSLAVTLFAIDFLFNRKLLDKKAIFDKLPFLLLAFIFGIIAVKAQQAGNAMADVDSYEFYKRIGFAGYAFTQYIFKLLVPVGLSAIYPYPDIIHKSLPAFYWLFLIPSTMVITAFFYYLKRSKTIAFCIAFFVINIFLLLQLMPVGSAIWADRYSYIPSIGYYALIGWLFYQISFKYSINRKLTYGIAGIYMIIIAIASFERCKIWENNISLWDDTLEKSPQAVVAWNNRGSIKDKANKHAEAIEDFTEAIKLKPDYTHAFYNRGTAKKNLAEELKDTLILKSAIDDFDYSIKLNHAFVEALHNRGLAKENLSDYVRTDKQRTGLLQSALVDLDKTISLNSNYKNALLNRGVIKGKLNRFDEAIEDFNQSIAFAPDSAQAYANRGLAKDFKGDYSGALTDYNKAIELKPDFETAYLNRGITYRKIKKFAESINDFNYAIKFDPKLPAAYYFRGLDLIVLNKKNEACKDFQMATKLGHPDAKQQFELNCNK
jgi:tetratricopeptide (TPR) repeat protein